MTHILRMHQHLAWGSLELLGPSRPPPTPHLPAGILMIEHLDALSLSLERLDLSRNRLTLVDSLGALTGLRELRLGHNQM